MRITALASFVLLTAACDPDLSGEFQPVADTLRAVTATAGLDTAAGPLPDPPGSVGHHAVYVPVYSYIYHRDQRRFPLTVTLTVRNTDPDRPVTIDRVVYFTSDGTPLRDYLAEPRTLERMATAEFVIADRDTTGGAGANFVVEWSSTVPISEPVIEAIMIGTQGQQGVSFTSVGRPIRRR